MIERYFQLPRRELVYLKFILEAFEGLSTLSTVDNRAGIVKVSYPACFAADMTGLLAALAGEIPLAEVAEPGTSCDLDKP